MIWIVIGAVLGVPTIFVVAQYNQLVALRNFIRNSWSNIDTELKRRYELIPNLVEAVKGYARHEREVLERVTELRRICLASNGPPDAQATDETELVHALQRLLVLAEDYPELKASRSFLELQQELVDTEDRIQAARRFYNGNVRDYRVKCESFPSNVVAGLFGFGPEAYFSVEPSVRNVPNVDF
jgi:LemA protein